MKEHEYLKNKIDLYRELIIDGKKSIKISFAMMFFYIFAIPYESWLLYSVCDHPTFVAICLGIVIASFIFYVINLTNIINHYRRNVSMLKLLKIAHSINCFASHENRQQESVSPEAGK